MSTECPDCRVGVNHCHGTLVLHPVEEPECTEPSCVELGAVRHALVIDCRECGCPCGDEASNTTSPAPDRLPHALRPTG